MKPFVHFSLVFCLYIALHNQRSTSSNFLVFHISGGISSGPAAFLLLFFVLTTLSSSSVNYPSLTSSWLLIMFLIDLSVTLGEFKEGVCSVEVGASKQNYLDAKPLT